MLKTRPVAAIRCSRYGQHARHNRADWTSPFKPTADGAGAARLPRPGLLGQAAGQGAERTALNPAGMPSILKIRFVPPVSILRSASNSLHKSAGAGRSQTMSFERTDAGDLSRNSRNGFRYRHGEQAMDRIFYRACAVTAAMAWMGMGSSHLTLGQLTQEAPPLVFETSSKHGGIGHGNLPRAIQEARLLELPAFAAADAQADVAPADATPEPTPTADWIPNSGSGEADFKATDLAEAESVVEASPSDLIDQWPMPQATP